MRRTVLIRSRPSEKGVHYLEHARASEDTSSAESG